MFKDVQKLKIKEANDKSLISDAAVIANHRQTDVFAGKMARAGMPLTGVQWQALKEKAGLYDDYYAREGLTSAIKFDPDYGTDAQRKLNPIDFASKIMVDSALRARTMQTERTM